MEDVRTGQKNGGSVWSMAGCIPPSSEAQAAQSSQADGAVPDASLDHLSEYETRNKSRIFTPFLLVDRGSEQ